MSAVFGIDLGTTNSVIAELREGRPVPIAIGGHPIVPSIVLFPEDGGRPAVGREARNLELSYPERTVRSVKRKMGQDFAYQIGGRTLSPPEVSAEILRALEEGAEAATGSEVRDVVITVPAYFNDAQRRATLQAGELAGLHVLRLLNEPTSAALIYEQVGDANAGPGHAGSEVILIYDLGGGTFDVSVLEVFEGVREVRATTGNSALGGDDFDELLVRLFLDRLKTEAHLDPREDPRAMARLRRLAEETKIRLSGEIEVHVREEFLLSQGGRPVHLDLQITRRQFEELVRQLLESTIELAQRAVADASLGEQPIARVCLVGGSTRIPLVRQLLDDAFHVDIHEEVDPDLAVGLGAAVQSGLLLGQPVERILVDVAAHTLGVRAISQDDEPGLEPDTFAPVLRRNTALPAERTEELYTMADNQALFRVEVFQGEWPRASQNSPVGAFDFPLSPLPAHSPVVVRFAYDLNGVVRVHVSQRGTANQKTVALKVADAGDRAQEAAAALAPAPASAVERKAQALLEQLTGAPKERLAGLLSRYRVAIGPARANAEDALLDFFLDHDSEIDAEEEG